MKMELILFFLLSLLISVSCHSQYYLTDPEYSEEGRIFSGNLIFEGEFNPDDYHYDWTFNNTKERLNPIVKLKIQISLECDKYLHIYVTDAEKKRWEQPFTISDSYKEKIKTCSQTKSLKDFGLSISEDITKPFYFSLTNPDTGELIFTTENGDFIFSDFFISFASFVTTNDVYGFGERYHELKLGDGKFTLWPNDTTGIHEDLGEGGLNAYGMHPCGMHRTANKAFIGLIFNNQNCQDIVIKSGYEEYENPVLLEHRTIGGVIDYYITVNENPDSTLRSIHEVIGHPTLPPYWALGYHQCRYGYHNDKEIRDVFENFIAYELPADTFWADIDILQDYRIFTLNEKNFKDLPSVIHDLHEHNYKFVPIVDIGFPVKEEDEFYRRGRDTNAFIKSNYTKKDLISYVWPGQAVFPDFFCDAGNELWSYAMEKYYQTVKYDGIWLDMNEPTMIWVQDYHRGEILPDGYSFDPDKNKYEYIPYAPGYRWEHLGVEDKTLSESSYSNIIEENEFLTGYNFRPLMSYKQNMITNSNLVRILGKRPFILSRSTAMSHGRHAFHWLGDNGSEYPAMRNGVNGIFQFQIYGIPMTGDDICGFNGETYDKLCARWMSLGVFFPFSRNHNSIGMRSQEPFAFGRDSYTYKSSKLALNMRYSLLRYIYTNLFRISLGEKGSIFKPLFFEYYTDENTVIDMAESFMLGDAFLIYPIYHDEENDIEVYMPKDDWSIFPSGEIYKTKKDWEGGKVTLSGEFFKIQIFMRGGQIFPYQNTFTKFIPNTNALQKEKTELYIIPDSDTHIASGDIIFDNDEYNTLTNGNYYYIHMDFYTDRMTFSINHEMYEAYNNKDIYISKLKFFRMKYLIENDQPDIARVELRSGKVAHVLINYISDDIFEFDLSDNNIRFYDITKILFIKN